MKPDLLETVASALSDSQSYRAVAAVFSLGEPNFEAD